MSSICPRCKKRVTTGMLRAGLGNCPYCFAEGLEVESMHEITKSMQKVLKVLREANRHGFTKDERAHGRAMISVLIMAIKDNEL